MSAAYTLEKQHNCNNDLIETGQTGFSKVMAR